MADTKTYELIKARADAMKSEKLHYENILQKMADDLYGSGDFNNERTPGQNRKSRIYDDTAAQMRILLAGAMHSLLVNPAKQFFGLRFSQPELNDIPEASRWLKAVEERVYQAFEAPQANFHAQLSEVFLDLVGFGTGSMFIDDVPGLGVRFSSRPLQEILISEDPAGNVDTVFRVFKMTARQAVEMWGEKADTAQKALEQKNFEAKHEYIHAIFPRDDVAAGNIDVTGMAWESVIVSMADQDVMSEGGYHELPIVTPRWTKEPGECYGRGCGHNALSSGLGLNQQKKTALMSGQLAVAPPRMVDSEGVLPSDISFAPHAIIPVNAMMSGMNPPIQELNTRARFDVSEALIQDDRDVVKAAFHWPLLQSLQDPRMTATQVLELSAQMQRHLAPILGRMQTELLEPMIDRVFAIEARAGRLPAVPGDVLQVGDDIKVDHRSAIFRAQQTDQARATLDFSSAVSNLAGTVPDVLDVVDWDAQVRELAEALGVPPSGLKTQDQVTQQRQARAELAAQEADAAAEAQAVDNISKLNRAGPVSAAA